MAIPGYAFATPSRTFADQSGLEKLADAASVVADIGSVGAGAYLSYKAFRDREYTNPLPRASFGGYLVKTGLRGLARHERSVKRAMNPPPPRRGPPARRRHFDIQFFGARRSHPFRRTEYFRKSRFRRRRFFPRY